MSVEKKIKVLEYRIFDLEKTIDLLTKKINHFEEVLPFHFNEFSKNEPLNAENLLSLKEACTILNISESKLMEWVKKDLIIYKRLGDINYFDKNELKLLFRKMMIQDLE